MARETNNELSRLPGFFFYPKCADGLEELSLGERVELLENQGHYGMTRIQNDPATRADLNDVLDNGRIPTHRRPGVPTPSFGRVPQDLREVEQLRS